MLTREGINTLVTELQRYKSNIYTLNPMQLAKYMRLKSSLVNYGIVITDSKLDMSKNDLVNEIMFILEENQHIQNTLSVHAPILAQNSFNADIATIEEERVQVRKQLFNEDIEIKLTHSGRMFSVQWNGRMTSCKINIPSSWGISLEQAMLLDIFQKELNTTNKDNSINLSKLGKLVFELLVRHNDYSIIKRLIELEFESSENIYVSEIDKRRLSRLTSKGFSVPVAALLLAFVEQVSNKCFSAYSITQILGFRKRLSKEFNYLLTSTKTS